MKLFHNEKGESNFPWTWLLIIAFLTGGFGLFSDDDEDDTEIKTEKKEIVEKVNKKIETAKEKFHEASDKAKIAYDKAKDEGKEFMDKWNGKKEETEPDVIKSKPAPDQEENKKDEKDPEYL